MSAKIDCEALISALVSADDDNIGKASADFAQQLWNGHIPDEKLLQLLRSESDKVRSEVAWAIADAHRPAIGVKWLLAHGLSDKAEGVRYWTTHYLLEAGPDAAAAVMTQLRGMTNDASERVRRIVSSIIERYGSH